MSASDIKLGKPFHFGVLGGRRDGTTDDFAVDGHPGVFATLEEAVQNARVSTFDYGGVVHLFYCVPIAKVSRRKTTIVKSAPDHVWKAVGEAALAGEPL